MMTVISYKGADLLVETWVADDLGALQTIEVLDTQTGLYNRRSVPRTHAVAQYLPEMLKRVDFLRRHDRGVT